MKTIRSSLLILALGLLAGSLFNGCASPDGGSASASVYYGAGFYDPWYYGGYHGDVIVPPPERPEPPARPTHPIAPTPTPRPTPMPSIPSRPRPSFRR